MMLHRIVAVALTLAAQAIRAQTDGCYGVSFGVEVRPEAQAKLVAFVADGKPTGAKFEQRVRETVHAILTMPEYQLC